MNHGYTLRAWGWDDYLEASFDTWRMQGFTAARVTVVHKERYEVITKEGPCWAEVTGKFRYRADASADYPAVGDWVAIQHYPDDAFALIHAVLPRRSRISRKMAGDNTDEQVLAANIDKIFLVSGLDQDFNIRRIERYLTLAADSGAKPYILLNKADLCTDAEANARAIRAVSPNVPVLVISAIHQKGVESILKIIGSGETAVLLGSSGVGKSTIINALLDDDRQKVQTVSGYMDKGRHTTVRRELFVLPGGGLLIDSPGLRELQLWNVEENLAVAFEDIAALAVHCRYRDCSHVQEPGCAVRQAIHDGILDKQRFNNYLKMLREIKFLALRQNEGAARAERLRWKSIKAAHKRSKKNI